MYALTCPPSSFDSANFPYRLYLYGKSTSRVHSPQKIRLSVYTALLRRRSLPPVRFLALRVSLLSFPTDFPLTPFKLTFDIFGCLSDIFPFFREPRLLGDFIFFLLDRSFDFALLTSFALDRLIPLSPIVPLRPDRILLSKNCGSCPWGKLESWLLIISNSA